MLADRSLVDEYNTFMSECAKFYSQITKIDTFVLDRASQNLQTH